MIITRILSSGITGVTVDEKKYKTAMGAIESNIKSYLYDGADWVDVDTSSVVSFATLGISIEGTAAANDEIVVAYHKPEMIVFAAGDGISAPDLNDNFEELRTQSNRNESDIATLDATTLKVDGTNVDDATVAAFNRNITVTLASSGTSNLTDNAEHFLAPTADCTLNLPAVAQGDQYSHTVNIAVQGSSYVVHLKYNGNNVTKHLLSDNAVDTTAPYNIFLMYNHIDGDWYYYVTQ